MSDVETFADRLTADETDIGRQIAGIYEGRGGNVDIDALRSRLSPSRETLVFQFVAGLLEGTPDTIGSVPTKEFLSTSYFLSRSPSEETLAHGHPGASFHCRNSHEV